MKRPKYCVPCSVIEKTGMHIIGDLLIMIYFLLGLAGLFIWPLMLAWVLIPIALTVRGIGKSMCSTCKVDFAASS